MLVRVKPSSPRATSRPHDGETDPLGLEICKLGCAMRPHRSLDVRIDLARQFDDPPLEDAGRDGHDQDLGLRYTGSIKHTRRCRIAVDRVEPLPAKLLEPPPVFLDDDEI